MQNSWRQMFCISKRLEGFGITSWRNTKHFTLSRAPLINSISPLKHLFPLSHSYSAFWASKTKNCHILNILKILFYAPSRVTYIKTLYYSQRNSTFCHCPVNTGWPNYLEKSQIGAQISYCFEQPSINPVIGTSYKHKRWKGKVFLYLFLFSVWYFLSQTFVACCEASFHPESWKSLNV